MQQDTTILGEIYRLNQQFLSMLHRSLLDNFADTVEAFQLSEDVAQALLKYTPENLEKIARTSQLLIRFHFSDVQVLRAFGTKPVLPVANQCEPASRVVV